MLPNIARCPADSPFYPARPGAHPLSSSTCVPMHHPQFKSPQAGTFNNARDRFGREQEIGALRNRKNQRISKTAKVESVLRDVVYLLWKRRIAVYRIQAINRLFRD